MNNLIRFCIIGIAVCLLGAGLIACVNHGFSNAVIGMIAVVVISLIAAAGAAFKHESDRRKTIATEDEQAREKREADEAAGRQSAVGAILIAIGVVAAAFTLFNYEITNEGSSYVNLARMNERMIFLGGAAFIILIGVLVIGFGQMKKR